MIISELLSDIQKMNLVLPEFQRDSCDGPFAQAFRSVAKFWVCGSGCLSADPEAADLAKVRWIIRIRRHVRGSVSIKKGNVHAVGATRFARARFCA